MSSVGLYCWRFSSGSCTPGAPERRLLADAAHCWRTGAAEDPPFQAGLTSTNGVPVRCPPSGLSLSTLASVSAGTDLGETARIQPPKSLRSTMLTPMSSARSRSSQMRPGPGVRRSRQQRRRMPESPRRPRRRRATGPAIRKTSRIPSGRVKAPPTAAAMTRQEADGTDYETLDLLRDRKPSRMFAARTDITRQHPSQSARLHGVDVHCPAGEHDDVRLTYSNGVAGATQLEVLLQRELQIIRSSNHRVRSGRRKDSAPATLT